MIITLGEEKKVFGGVIIEDRDTDFIAGGVSKITYEAVNLNGDWKKWYSVYEKQKKKTETSSCVTFSALNSIEAQMNKQIAEGHFTEEAIKFFKDNGYLINGQFNFSERFTAIMSGTTSDGNSCQKVWDSIRKDGLLPEADCPFTDNMTSAQYFKNDITQAQKDKAKRILDYIEVQYEWIIQNSVVLLVEWERELMAKHLKQAPLQLITPVCHWNAKPTPCGSVECQHATSEWGINDGYPIIDHYDPFEKVLSRDYIIRYALKGVVTINDKYKKQIMKLIREKGRKETFTVINGQNYYISSTKAFNDLAAENMAAWDKVEEVDGPIEIHGVIAG